MLPEFIVIDDDEINNIICAKNIRQTFSHATITTFTDPVAGLEYMKASYAPIKNEDLIIFLDIAMPVLNGWDVLEQVRSFPKRVKKHLKIFILTSSINPKDREKAANDPLVLGFISKPLELTMLHGIFEGEIKTGAGLPGAEGQYKPPSQQLHHDEVV